MQTAPCSLSLPSPRPRLLFLPTPPLPPEIVLGSVTNVREAVGWLGYSYLARRLERNPLAYGVSYDTLVMDPGLDREWAGGGGGGCRGGVILNCCRKGGRRVQGAWPCREQGAICCRGEGQFSNGERWRKGVIESHA